LTSKVDTRNQIRPAHVARSTAARRVHNRDEAGGNDGTLFEGCGLTVLKVGNWAVKPVARVVELLLSALHKPVTATH